MQQLEISAWTTGGDVANTAGIPLKIPIQRSSYHSKNFMQGAYTLGDVLKSNGYYNELISSAKTSFGGMMDYFTKHGTYSILDSSTRRYYGITLDEKGSSKWGFNDHYLFEIAKKRLNTISKKYDAFNIAIQTIDTHYVDGTIGWYSEDKFDTQYENVYATESRLIYNFIKWVKEQDFYENTTIVIVGDHVSMQTNYFSERGATKRYVYNCYINPIKKAKNTANRIYTSLDTYPSILSSLGAKIEGEQLGLGVNLFSSEQTLSEKYGFDYFNAELKKKSIFYNDYILGKDYKKLLKKAKTENVYDIEESHG